METAPGERAHLPFEGLSRNVVELRAGVRLTQHAVISQDQDQSGQNLTENRERKKSFCSLTSPE